MNSRSGQAFLVMVFLIGGVISLIGITLGFLANSSVDTSYGYQAGVRAEAVAETGVEDALLQLARNSAFSNSSGYSVPVGSSTATVTVAQNAPSAGFVTIVSAATVLSRNKKMYVVAAVSTTTQMNVVSWSIIQ